ncbi:ATP-dependent DNA helicase [Trichonephila clavipes]|nr:ATP-dependent DNA helicase [Trichonephila clavipes]
MFLYPSINTMVNRLPRNVNDDYCANVHIKRRKIHRTSYLMGLVTKRTIKAWLQYLLASPLYRMYNVTIDDKFFYLNQSTSQVPQEEISENITIEESLTAQQQALIWNKEKFLRIAPGEANVPRTLLFDEHAEELSWVILETSGKELERVTPFMIATNELRRVDYPQHSLYMAIKSMRVRE